MLATLSIIGVVIATCVVLYVAFAKHGYYKLISFLGIPTPYLKLRVLENVHAFGIERKRKKYAWGIAERYNYKMSFFQLVAHEQATFGADELYTRALEQKFEHYFTPYHSHTLLDLLREESTSDRAFVWILGKLFNKGIPEIREEVYRYVSQYIDPELFHNERRRSALYALLLIFVTEIPTHVLENMFCRVRGYWKRWDTESLLARELLNRRDLDTFTRMQILSYVRTSSDFASEISTFVEPVPSNVLLHRVISQGASEAERYIALAALEKRTDWIPIDIPENTVLIGDLLAVLNREQNHQIREGLAQLCWHCLMRIQELHSQSVAVKN